MTILLSRRRALAGSLLALPAFGLAATGSTLWTENAQAAGDSASTRLEGVVGEVVRPLMNQYDIPGMAAALTVNGKRHIFNYGVASKESGRPVSEDTIFEIGSISKTFTATLAALAEVRGKLRLSEKASKYLPALAGSSLDRISLLDLGTYTAGGLPLQFPDDVTDEAGMVSFYRGWRPGYATGTHRVYSNPSIGLFGNLAARSMGKSFDDLMEGELFPALGLTRTHIRVPHDRMDSYAYGYSKDNKPIRVTPGMLDAEAYGVKTTASDMIRFVEANMKGVKLDDDLQRAIEATHVGYYRIGGMTQGLGWEMYEYPTGLDQLLSGNSSDMALKPNKAIRLDPPRQPVDDLLINKTGSTNGFGAYVAFVPARRMGIVLLGNRNYPIPARVKAAYRILKSLEDEIQ